MADRTNERLFGVLFEALAGYADSYVGDDWEPDTEGDDLTILALELFALSKHYDFSPYQMEVDDAMARLGLARSIGGSEYDYVDCPHLEEFLDFDAVEMFAPTLRPQPPRDLPSGFVEGLFIPSTEKVDVTDFLEDFNKRLRAQVSREVDPLN